LATPQFVSDLSLDYARDDRDFAEGS